MQKLTKLTIILLMVLTSLFFAACGKDDTDAEDPVLVSSIVLDVETLTLLVGDTYTFEALVLPENAENKTITYSSQKPNVASIHSTTGVLTAVAVGNVMITATSTDTSNKFDYVQVTVLAQAIELATPANFALDEDEYKLTWSPVANALGYILLINNIAQTEIPVDVTEHKITGFNALNTYKIKAMGDEHIKISSAASAAITAKILATPANFNNTDDTISWQTVSGAESYELWLNGAIIDMGLDTSIQLDLSEVQTYEIKVRALISGPNSYSSKYTESIEIIRLAVPIDAAHQQGGIVWQAVPDAISYLVSVNEEEVITKQTNYKLPLDAAAQEYTFKVKAVGDNDKILDSLYSLEFVTTKLPTPENLRIQQGKLMWDAVSLAQSYSLKINQQVIQVGQVTEFELLDNYLSGIYTINVMANGNEDAYTNSSYSSLISATKLAATSQVSVVDGTIAWLAVPNATKYVLTIGEQQFETTNTYFNAGAEIAVGEHFVTISSQAENYLYSKNTAEKLVHKLSVPTNFRVEQGVLTWSSVAYATSYEIVAGSNTFNSGNLNTYVLPLTGGNSYDIKIRTKGDNKKHLTSEFTEIITATKLAKPQNIIIENGYINTTPIANASSYILEVNGVQVPLTQEMFPYYLNGISGEFYNIRLIAIGSNEFLNSDFSEVVAVYQLPQVQNLQIANSSLTWTHLDGINEYEVWIKLQENEEYDRATDLFYSTSNSYDLTPISSGKYDVKVRARGDDLHDIVGADSIELEFEKLAMPLEFELKSGMLVWKSVTNATKYLIKINGQTQEFTNNNYYTLDDSYGVATYSIKVAAYGDGANYITSEWTNEITADRLETPQNVRVVDGQVEWSAVIGATNYIVYVAGNYYIGQVVEGVSTYVRWYSTNDYELELVDTVLPRFETYSVYPAGVHQVEVFAVNETGFASKPTQPFTVNKLNYPRNLRVENGIIKWDAVLNGNYGYRLLINNDDIDTTDLSYNFINHENYKPNSFTITTLTYGDMGDGTGNNINSNYSNSVNIIVMESPSSLRVLDGLINWVPVQGAVDYEILVYEKLGEDNYQLLTIDTELLTGNGSNFLLGENYAAGEYGIKIRAIGDGSRYITSEFTENFLDVIKLPIPTGLGLTAGKITYNAVNNATGYQVLANDIFAQAGANTVYELEERFLAGPYNLSVRAVGDNVIYLTSNLSSIKTATKLEKIQNFRVENGVLKWTPTDNQSILFVNDNEYVLGYVSSYELPNSFAQGNYQIKIKARGTDNNLLNSNYTDIIEVYKMNTVTNLRVEEGIIKWNAPITPIGFTEGAPNGYTLKIKNSQLQETQVNLARDITGYVLPSQYIADEYYITIQTKGDSSNQLNSIKVAIEITKLQIPAAIKLITVGEDYYLVWSQVPLTELYRIVIQSPAPDGETYETNVQVDTTIPTNLIEDPDQAGQYLVAYKVVAQLEIGEHYVRVQAIGNSTNIVNSDLRQAITVTKPSTPTNLTINNGVVAWDASTYATEYKLSIIFDSEEPYYVTTENTYYYLTDLGVYEVMVSAYYSGSLYSDYTPITAPYQFDMFNAGNGSEVTPFEIVNAEQLRNVKYNPTAHYILLNHIVLNTDNFEPIGTLEKPFTGVFDGNAKEIYNLNINSNYTYSGMFGYIDTTAVIKNLSLVNVNITSSSQYTGGVAGYNKGTIESVYVAGNISPVLNDSAITLYAGGVVGYNKGVVQLTTAQVQVEPINASNLVYAGGIAGYNNGLIEKSGTNSSSNVEANFAGGVAGYNNGNIKESYNKGSVTGVSASTQDGFAGGIAGYNLNTDAIGGYTGLIINSYNWGAISATSATARYAYAGGIVGYNRYLSSTSFGEVKWSYNAGSVTATNTFNTNLRYVAGIAGWNENTGKLTESYYINTIGQASNGVTGIDCTSRTDAELRSATFETFLNDKNGLGSDIWTRIGFNNYVQLSWED